MADKQEWITVNGACVPLDKNGDLQGSVGRKIEKDTDVSEKKKQIKNALQEIADGKEEVTLNKLRNDLEQYGGTNDVTLIRGNKKEGILHIIENGREHYLGDILDTVVEGKIIRRVEGNNSIVLQKDNVQAILALERFRQKKTWLLTGWDITTDPKKEKQEYLKKKGLASDEWGKVGAIHPPTQTEPIRSRHCLGADEDLEKIINQLKKMSSMNKKTVVFDSASKRSIDQNGFMHVEISNITKESVDPYRGYEIPRAKAFGLDPDKIYMGYRSGEELKKAAHTFNGLPITREHHVDSAENPQREHRVGSIGTDCIYNAPYLQAGVTITDGEAIRKIESGERMEFSAGYFFEPVFEKGEFGGKAYDFIMTEIKGNHVALVETGRAGADVCVADSGENIQQLQENITNNQNEDNMEEIKKETQAQDEDLREEWKKDTEFEEKKEELLKDECKPAADDDDDIAEILQKAGIETGDEELKKAFLAGMAYAKKELENPAKSEEVLEKKTVVEEKEDVRPAMDADTIKRQLRQELRDVQNAVREVRPLVGELDAMAFDSGDAVYFKACEVMGVNASRRTARDVCRALLSTGRTMQPVMAMDSGMHGFRSRFDNN